MDAATARTIAQQVLGVLAQSLNLSRAADVAAELAPVVAQVGEVAVPLGWTWRPMLDTRGQALSDSSAQPWGSWPDLLSHCRLTVQPKGQAKLSLRWR